MLHLQQRHKQSEVDVNHGVQLGLDSVKLAHYCTVFTCPIVKVAPCNAQLYSEVSHYRSALRTN